MCAAADFQDAAGFSYTFGCSMITMSVWARVTHRLFYDHNVGLSRSHTSAVLWSQCQSEPESTHRLFAMITIVKSLSRSHTCFAVLWSHMFMIWAGCHTSADSMISQCQSKEPESHIGCSMIQYYCQSWFCRSSQYRLFYDHNVSLSRSHTLAVIHDHRWPVWCRMSHIGCFYDHNVGNWAGVTHRLVLRWSQCQSEPESHISCSMITMSVWAGVTHQLCLNWSHICQSVSRSHIYRLFYDHNVGLMPESHIGLFSWSQCQSGIAGSHTVVLILWSQCRSWAGCHTIDHVLWSQCQSEPESWHRMLFYDHNVQSEPESHIG